MVLLQGERLTLRSYEEKDFSDIVQHANDMQVAQNMASFEYPYTEDMAKGWISLARSDEMKGRHFAIVLDGKVIGGCGFDLKDGLHKNIASGGYWLGREFWGNGYATEAWKLIVDYAFTNFDIHRLEAGVYSWNPASSRVLEKTGFTREGCLRRRVTRFETVGDEIYYSLLREEWERKSND